MRQGGHAVDAAVVTALCQGIHNPQASGIGGGTFMMIRSANGSLEVIDAREPAASMASTHMYAGKLLIASLAHGLTATACAEFAEDAWTGLATCTS